MGQEQTSKMNAQQLQTKLDYANKRVKFAWGKYYESANEHHENALQQYNYYRAKADDREIPTHIKNEMMEMAKELKKKWECPICMDFIAHDDLVITNCGHYYCKGCLDSWKEQEKKNGNNTWKCANCNRRHSHKD